MPVPPTHATVSRVREARKELLNYHAERAVATGLAFHGCARDRRRVAAARGTDRGHRELAGRELGALRSAGPVDLALAGGANAGAEPVRARRAPPAGRWRGRRRWWRCVRGPVRRNRLQRRSGLAVRHDAAEQRARRAARLARTQRRAADQDHHNDHRSHPAMLPPSAGAISIRNAEANIAEHRVGVVVRGVLVVSPARAERRNGAARHARAGDWRRRRGVPVRRQGAPTRVVLARRPLDGIAAGSDAAAELGAGGQRWLRPAPNHHRDHHDCHRSHPPSLSRALTPRNPPHIAAPTSHAPYPRRNCQ